MRVFRWLCLGLVAAAPLVAAAAPPGEVVPIAPSAGGEVDTDDITFTVGNATDLDSVVVNLSVEVWSDLLGTVAFTGNAAQSTGAETTFVADVDLVDDVTHFWRARAIDSSGEMGPWSTLRAFVYNPENDLPVGGDAITPLDGATVATVLPGFVVISPSDPDDSELTIRFELTTDPDWGIVEFTSGDMSAGAITSSFQTLLPLDDGNLYIWRVVISDGVNVVHKPHGFFRVNLGNDAPTAAIVIAPLDGSDIASVNPMLNADGVIDEDGDPFQYYFEIDRTPTFSSTDRQESGPIAPADQGAFWTPPVPLTENVTYWWRVEGRDPTTSGDAAFSSFRVNAVNDPPSTSLVLDPAPDEVVIGSLAQVAFVPGQDPEGTEVTYEVSAVADGDVAATATGTAAVGPVTVALFDEPLPPGRYTIRVTVFDAEGVPSGMVSVAVQVRSFPGSGGGGCSCAVSESSGSRHGLLALAALAGVAITGCRRRNRR